MAHMVLQDTVQITDQADAGNNQESIVYSHIVMMREIAQWGCAGSTRCKKHHTATVTHVLHHEIVHTYTRTSAIMCVGIMLRGAPC